jgi:hypothetical protein
VRKSGTTAIGVNIGDKQSKRADSKNPSSRMMDLDGIGCHLEQVILHQQVHDEINLLDVRKAWLIGFGNASIRERQT